ncbi:MAG: penicillin-binding protein 1A [Wenzhouxiangellaceae bacterium]|nr:penicillin-binding protein 1A [Wenzhouxiangellaceae bacterium]
MLWLIIAPSLPSVDTLRDVELQVPLRIYSADRKLITQVGEQRRIPLATDEIPLQLRQAFLAAEDDNFYNHPGIDWRGTLRGVIGYARYLGQRRVPGGSTITQQVARRFFLSNEFSVVRKVREIFLAMRIEHELTKDEILELYLNKEFLGHRAYGVGAAAQIYYGKTVDELTLAEMAMIAGLPQRPSAVNPVTNPSAALERRAYVLGRMFDEGFITETEYRTAMATPDRATLHGPQRELNAPWIAEIARQQAVERLGANEAYTRGYHIFTTVESELQRAATRAVRDGLRAYDRRHGWRGPERTLPAEVLDDREALLDELEGTPVIGDLVPAIVLESDAGQAALLLAGGTEVRLTLAEVEWAREHLARDALGRRPEAVDQVLAPGDLVRLRPKAPDPEPAGDADRAAGGEWQLAQVPEAQAALVSLKPQSGAVVALVGGFDFGASQFNRATQSRRQPGSAFKPFIYAAALDHGYTPASLVNDAPVVFDDPSQERSWKPMNFSERFFGPTRLREGMIHSRNLISVRLVLDIGVQPTIDYVTDFGFERGEIPNGPSMALGSASITPLDLAGAYAVFANGGYAIEPFFVHAIHDDQGRELDLPRHPIVCPECERDAGRQLEASAPDAAAEERTALRTLNLGSTTPETVGGEAESGDADVTSEEEQFEFHGPPEPLLAERVLSPQTTWLIRSMMADVIESGTGRRARALGRNDLAGKTGTTNDQRDTWFAGFNDELVTTVWVGLDNNESLGRLEQGGVTALPIWVDYMKAALAGVPERTRPVPVGIVEASIDPKTGLRVRPGTPGAIREWFPAGNLPPMSDTVEGAEDDEAVDPYEIY